MNVENKTTIQMALNKADELSIAVEGAAVPQIINLCLATIELVCKKSIASAIEQGKDELFIKAIEEDMYEMINMGASSLLTKCFPGIEMRPDLTVEAVLDAENTLLSDDDNIKRYGDAYNETTQAVRDAIAVPHTAAELKAAVENNLNRAGKRALNKKSNRSR